ncbi:MAG TPA: DHH family phosphoesterase, partial [Chryseolinea sp.]|nr:DHH family phosphoesterase [Chryseolinea sp.]
MEKIRDFKEYLKNPRKTVIVTHFKPDADALGSSLGLAHYLKKKGHGVTVITPSDYPDFISWMPGNKDVMIYQKEKSEKFAQRIKETDLLFCLDFSCLNRINDLGEMVRKSPAKKVLIDHHLEPEKFADFEQWDDTAASTAELVYKLIEELGDKELIDADIANCLYAGLMTDTGSFRHSNTSHQVFQV